MSTTHWIDALSAADLPTDDVHGIAVAGRDIAIYTVGDEVDATDNTCTDGRARLCEGFLDGHEIECPLHQGRFDVRDGRPTCRPATEALRSHPVKVEGGRVFLQLRDGPSSRARRSGQGLRFLWSLHRPSRPRWACQPPQRAL